MAFSLPVPSELFLQVLEELEGDRPSLFQAVLVNKTWFAAAVKVLWRRPPFWAISLAEDRQFYANEIRALDFIDFRPTFLDYLDIQPDDRFMWLTAYDGLNLPQLRSVTLDNCSLRFEMIAKFLTPTLKSLISTGTAIRADSEIPEALKCTHLETLVLDDTPNNIISCNLPRLIRSCKRLKSVKLNLGPHEAVALKITLRLLSRERLQNLELEGVWFDEQAIRDLLEQLPGPFPMLRALSINARSSTVACMLAQTPSLQSLNLRFQDDPPFGVLSFATAFRDLVGISIEYHETTTLNFSDLQVLERFRQLKSLVIAPEVSTPWNPLQGVEADVVPFLAAFSCLENCRIRCADGPKGTIALLQLGQACPLLKTFDMKAMRLGISQEREGEVRGPVLPGLSKLFIDEYDSQLSVHHTAEIIAKHAPELTPYLGQFTYRTFGSRVSAQLHYLWQQRFLNRRRSPSSCR